MITGFVIIIGGRLAGIFFKINVPTVLIDEPEDSGDGKSSGG